MGTFVEFVYDQPADRPIQHRRTNLSHDAWSACAIGDYMCEVFGATREQVGKAPYHTDDSDIRKITESDTVASALNRNYCETYGELQLLYDTRSLEEMQRIVSLNNS